MFHFSFINTPFSVDISSDIIASIFQKIADSNPIPQNGTINIVFIWDTEMQALNKQYREKDMTTDVLSFHYFEDFSSLSPENTAGEILLSESKVRSQAQDYSHSVEAEVYKLVIHWILHIIGYDHETDEEFNVMHPKEIEVTNLLRDQYQLRIID